MNEDLTEEEMRRALFGSANKAPLRSVASPASSVTGRSQPAGAVPKRRVTGAALSRLRVTLHVTKEFEGKIDVFTYDASTLSTLLAEQEAKAAARKKRYRYFEVVSILPTGQ